MSESGTEFLSFFSLPLRHFLCRFPIVMAHTQTLMVCRVNKLCPVSTMRLYVVHHRGSDSMAYPGAFPAERFPEQLVRPQIFDPDWIVVIIMPLSAFAPLGFLWLVIWTIPLSGQLWTPWLLTWPERLHGHGLSPPGKTKSAQATTTRLGVIGSGAGLIGLWLRRFNIRNRFSSAPFAHARQVTNDGGWI